MREAAKLRSKRERTEAERPFAEKIFRWGDELKLELILTERPPPPL